MAKAEAILKVGASTIAAVKSNTVPKADPLGVARVAGIQAAKNTSSTIPYCHQVPLDFVAVEFSIDVQSIVIRTEVRAVWKTGVEMEALVAASVAALTLYDMLKPIDDSMVISSVKLVEKRGGKSDLWETGEGLTAAVVVVSDSVSEKQRHDTSGRFLADRLRELKFNVVALEVLPDDREMIETKLKDLADRLEVDLILTTGGTGLGPRDLTPEAMAAVIEKRLEGVERHLQQFGQIRIPTAMLSRGIAGARRKTLIVNLPGSRSAVEDGMNALFPMLLHAFRMMRGEGHNRAEHRGD